MLNKRKNTARVSLSVGFEQTANDFRASREHIHYIRKMLRASSRNNYKSSFYDSHYSFSQTKEQINYKQKHKLMVSNKQSGL